MGLDMVYQALPDDPELWKRLLSDEEMREMLGSLPFYIREGGNVLRAGRIGQEAKALRNILPGVERRNFDLGRWWDRLHYLLSAERRGDQVIEKGSDLGTVAIHGERVVTWQGEPVLSGQGIKIRYTSPATVIQIAAFLEEIPDQELRSHYDSAVMEEAGVYKGVGAREWEDTLRSINDFRRFYWDVAANKEGVLVCLN